MIAGHNYARHFSPIKGISPESGVFFTNEEGNVYSYRVAWAETLAPDRVEEMAKSRFTAILVLCIFSVFFMGCGRDGVQTESAVQREVSPAEKEPEAQDILLQGSRHPDSVK